MRRWSRESRPRCFAAWLESPRRPGPVMARAGAGPGPVLQASIFFNSVDVGAHSLGAVSGSAIRPLYLDRGPIAVDPMSKSMTKGA
jgi:hypothetical protein